MTRTPLTSDQATIVRLARQALADSESPDWAANWAQNTGRLEFTISQLLELVGELTGAGQQENITLGDRP